MKTSGIVAIVVISVFVSLGIGAVGGLGWGMVWGQKQLFSSMQQCTIVEKERTR